MPDILGYWDRSADDPDFNPFTGNVEKGYAEGLRKEAEEALFLETLLKATEIYGVLERCEDRITVGHRDALLDELEKKYIPILLKPVPEVPDQEVYAEQIVNIFKSYNRNIEKNILHDNKPVELDV